VSGTNPTLNILTNGAGYDFEIDWGDPAGTSGYTQRFIGTTPAVSHTYTGNYVSGDTVHISIRGSFPTLYCANNAVCQKLLSIDQWGDNSWTTFTRSFYGASNLAILANDTPNLTNVVDMSIMFRGAVNLTGNFSGWDTSRIQTFDQLFYGATNFNQDLSAWNTSSLTNMRYLFRNTAFNQPVNTWDTSKVTNMEYTFFGASGFNQDLSSWDTSKVQNFTSILQGASSFDRDISSWVITGTTTAASFANMLNGTNLSVYNYNQLLDQRSKQS
jgi:surface protein